jgi:trans-2,3-dihydro-3-hydroxyanthranilate isomerase
MRQNAPVFTGTFSPDRLADVLSLPKDAIDSRFPVEEVSTGLPFIIVPLRTREDVRKAVIDREAYGDLIRTTEAKAVFIFCPEPYLSENTFNARMFADFLGVPEDPATGSANGCLARISSGTGIFRAISLISAWSRATRYTGRP